MRKRSYIFAVALFCLSCHRKSVPVVTDRTQFPPAPAHTPIPPSSPEYLAAGKMVYEGKCNRCHDLKAPDAYTAQRWESILKSMIPRARLTDEQAKQLTAFVMNGAKK